MQPLVELFVLWKEGGSLNILGMPAASAEILLRMDHEFKCVRGKSA